MQLTSHKHTRKTGGKKAMWLFIFWAGQCEHVGWWGTWDECIPKPEISLDAQESTNPFLFLDGAVCRSSYLKEVHTYLCYCLGTQRKEQKSIWNLEEFLATTVVTISREPEEQAQATTVTTQASQMQEPEVRERVSCDVTWALLKISRDLNSQVERM